MGSDGRRWQRSGDGLVDLAKMKILQGTMRRGKSFGLNPLVSVNPFMFP